jgi:hypothetical protein
MGIVWSLSTQDSDIRPANPIHALVVFYISSRSSTKRRLLPPFRPSRTRAISDLFHTGWLFKHHGGHAGFFSLRSKPRPDPVHLWPCFTYHLAAPSSNDCCPIFTLAQSARSFRPLPPAFSIRPGYVNNMGNMSTFFHSDRNLNIRIGDLANRCFRADLCMTNFDKTDKVSQFYGVLLGSI